MAETIKTYIVHLNNGKTVVIAADPDEMPYISEDKILEIYGQDGTTVTFNWNHVAYYRPDEFELPEEVDAEKITEALKAQDTVPQRIQFGPYL